MLKLFVSSFIQLENINNVVDQERDALNTSKM